MIGIIDVGDGMRGAYSAGVLDRCLDENIEFDEHIGLSSGASNLASFIAKQRGRNYNFYGHYSFRPSYKGYFHKLRNDNFFNLDYIYRTISKGTGEDPLDFSAIKNSNKLFYIGISDAYIGESRFFDAKEMAPDDYGFLKASWCFPWYNEPYFWKGFAMYDGAITAPIPAKKALADGCDKVVVLLTLPRNYYRRDMFDSFFARGIKEKYPDMAHATVLRSVLYNQQLEECKALEAEGKVLIVAPKESFRMSPVSSSPRMIRKLYDAGYADGLEIKAFLENKWGGA